MINRKKLLYFHKTIAAYFHTNKNFYLNKLNFLIFILTQIEKPVVNLKN